jgi:hypothetical protein
MKRRTFLNWAGIGLLASYFPISLNACSQGSGDRDTPRTTTNEEEDLVWITTKMGGGTGIRFYILMSLNLNRLSLVKVRSFLV